MSDPTAAVHVALPSTLDAAGYARSLLTRTCDHLPPAAVEAARVVLTELVVNAVEHGSPPIRCHMQCDDDGLHVEVSDAGPAAPVHRDAASDEEGGRGVALVARLSRSWGVRPATAGKTIWAHITTHHAEALLSA